MNRIIEKLRKLESEALRFSMFDIDAAQSDEKIRVFKERLERLENSHSRSWFGDHASTYYPGFVAPPDGRSFDVEWGFTYGFGGQHNEDWKVFTRNEIREFVFKGIGEEFYSQLNTHADTLLTQTTAIYDQTLDTLEALTNKNMSSSFSRYKARIENEFEPYSPADYVNSSSRSAPRVTRDSEEILKGQSVPAHVQYQASLRSIEINKEHLSQLAGTIRNVIEALALDESDAIGSTLPTKIFIGHGRSTQWRALKDFLSERLHLEFEEFNRVSPAGISTQERLTEMLSSCNFAFLVLTAEDIHNDGSIHARENVIHEVGLFQGHLGWRRAIVVLEEGCEEFSNVAGLGQIRFAKGIMSTCFEEIRKVLEREKIIT